MSIMVRERGAASLREDQWLAVSADPAFRDLVSRSILGAKPGRGGGWELTAAGYVGRAVLGGLKVVVVEKISGSLSSMIEIVAPRAIKFARAPSPIVTDMPPQVILAEMLVAATRAYLSGHALAEYREARVTGAFLTGSLDVPRTVALRTRGIRHAVAFRHHRVTDDLPLNRVLWCALGEIASDEGARSVGEDLAAAARALRRAFGDSAASAADLTPREVLAEAVAEANEMGRNAVLTEAASLALAIVQGAASSDRQVADTKMPRSWFVNLENLFERVIRICIAEVLEGVAKVSGPDRDNPLFRNPATRYPANPDVVVRMAGQVAILDAKYKDRTGDPDAAEVYQLLCHASALGADKAALVYPSEHARNFTYLGRSSTGCEIWSFGLDLSRPRASMREALQQMGLASVKQAT